MDNISIRPARRAHLDDIPRIELAATAQFSEADLPQSIRYRVTPAEDLREALDNQSLWVAVGPGGQIVGFAMANSVDGDAYLDELDVLPDFGRRGIGSRLVTTVVDWARSAGFSRLSLITFRHVPWNAPFYTKLGFAILEPQEHGPEIAGLIEDERRAGIDTRNRVAMRMDLQ